MYVDSFITFPFNNRAQNLFLPSQCFTSTTASCSPTLITLSSAKAPRLRNDTDHHLTDMWREERRHFVASSSLYLAKFFPVWAFNVSESDFPVCEDCNLRNALHVNSPRKARAVNVESRRECFVCSARDKFLRHARQNFAVWLIHMQMWSKFENNDNIQTRTEAPFGCEEPDDDEYSCVAINYTSNSSYRVDGEGGGWWLGSAFLPLLACAVSFVLAAQRCRSTQEHIKHILRLLFCALRWRFIAVCLGDQAEARGENFIVLYYFRFSFLFCCAARQVQIIFYESAML